MSVNKKIENLASFYLINACQDMEDEDLFESDLFENEENSSEEENAIVMLGLTSLFGMRYIEKRFHNVIKSRDWYKKILPNYDDSRFKIIIRMDSINFQKLVSILSDNPIFQSNSNNSQASVEL